MLSLFFSCNKSGSFYCEYPPPFYSFFYSHSPHKFRVTSLFEWCGDVTMSFRASHSFLIRTIPFSVVKGDNQEEHGSNILFECIQSSPSFCSFWFHSNSWDDEKQKQCVLYSDILISCHPQVCFLSSYSFKYMGGGGVGF